jgi:hypothetical protein
MGVSPTFYNIEFENGLKICLSATNVEWIENEIKTNLKTQWQ